MMLGSRSWICLRGLTSGGSLRSFLACTIKNRSARRAVRFALPETEASILINLGIDNANHQSIGSQRPRFGSSEEQVAGFAGLPPASWSVHSRVHDDAEEAELGTS